MVLVDRSKAGFLNYVSPPSTRTETTCLFRDQVGVEAEVTEAR